ncbi:MAG: sulfurtransferase [Myxococcales bacterium]|nr:sulfurtransferase [Myxococcales bacterium]
MRVRMLALLLACGSAYAGKPLLLKPPALKGARQVLILDARPTEKYESGHLPGAISLPWIDLAEMPLSAEAKAPAEAAEILTSRGIRSDRWVVVYGDAAEGWGEEGRLVWTLLYLGHRQVSLLEGGFPAWKRQGLPVTTEGPGLPSGTFRSAPVAALRADKAQVKAASEGAEVAILDVRDPDEFAGAIKFNERRGGHVPRAINLPWKQLFTEDGSLLPPDRVRKLLERLGVSPKQPVIVYCTGGVRSGLAFVALLNAGYRVSSFEASFWEWASDSSLPVVTGP